MRTLRIVFMGTPDFAVGTLKALLHADYNVVGVITAPDKPAGRGRKLTESAVKTFAVSRGLPVLQPQNLKDPGFLEQLKQLDANLQIVVAFRMLPEVVWKMPEFGTFNLHASLLPDYRGAAPINWAIINGETLTGVTTFFIDHMIDTGAIIAKEEVPIPGDMTAGELHDQLMEKGAGLVVKTVESIQKNAVTTTPQPNVSNQKSAPKIHKETCKIKWNNGTKDIYNHIRGLSPFPTAWSYMANKDEKVAVKIFRGLPIYESHNLLPGTIRVAESGVKVATLDGFIELLEIQLPGRRKMLIKDLLNGYDFDPNAKML
ncbi:methionyl-tRNA formyltransferase [Ascidiimonas aurantiaca]|uniref:methionyl-tRNA formyltransferase n=1 Tax=Ascidiimonas aurantiaca TaxID=1685432 RepID=UPI0030EB58A3